MGAALKIDIHGEKGGSSNPKSSTEASDSLRSTNRAKLLIAVGEGEFEGTPTDADIYLDNTPLRETLKKTSKSAEIRQSRKMKG
ncbi:hypothetical protein LCG56_11355 [Pseudomonas cannabina pv. alisalensis]|uniref:Uncharacterized protein n=1 Tax=Pseudomonas syringae pv. maculicola str. ES4326 TaxID=629265 RepID=A0A8T8C625_PSEYM|nr:MULTISPECIES: hypothetical protein [Pseudomonas syringae group]QHE98979.1 hypothetical protein PMA4326_021835 [Pseudomonas syringae pv. maculicola str. ES4326]QQN21239.1 hypothetical protein JGS08_22065 [Pseudomonas cannabina pv. alisalensis]UBY99641.1 hypothetical protein LCG56_11355 [Pseudomonas cannabina pv. alisalensis]